MAQDNKTLAIIGGRISFADGRLFAHFAFAKIVEEFAKHYKHIYLSSPLKSQISAEEDYPLPSNITLVPQPDWKNTLDSIRYLSEIKKSYEQVISASDHVFVRGNPVAATSSLYRYCVQNDKPVCHWLVGNPMALLQSHKRGNFIKDIAGRFYIWQWEKKLLRGRSVANGSFLCNGQELADRYPTPKTYVTISTTLAQDDFFEREDTCTGNVITLLSLCYIRPEKGIEYLIEALTKLKVNKHVKLLIAGSRDRYSKYQAKLDNLVRNYNLEKSISWIGHVRYQEIPDLMRGSDIFVLPTLSEGTPRVLIEARANSLPIVATDVGGIPTSVTDGHDGLLVASKDSKSLADAISRIIEDGKLRKDLIMNGYAAARKMTIDEFVSFAMECLLHKDPGGSDAR